MSTVKLLPICYTVSLSMYGQGLSSEQTSKAVQAQVGNITSLSTHHWQTVDTRAIYYPCGQTQAANVLPITPRLSLLDLSFSALLFSGYSVAFQASYCLCICAWVCMGVRGLCFKKKKKKTHCKKVHSYNLSLPSTLSYSLALCLSSITLITLLIGSCNALLSQLKQA